MKYTREYITKLISDYKSCYNMPFVVEVCGTPNSGKTSAIQTFEKVLKRNGIKYKVIYEAATKCKIKDKLSIDFNLWTLSETLKQLLESFHGNYDIIICERGLLDTICWCNLYLQDDLITQQEFQVLLDYMLLPRFIDRIQCYYAMKCSVEVSMDRENLSGLLDSTGSIINATVLNKYNTSLERVVKIYREQFNKIIELDTSDLSQTDINRTFVSSILGYMYNLFI